MSDRERLAEVVQAEMLLLECLKGEVCTLAPCTCAQHIADRLLASGVMRRPEPGSEAEQAMVERFGGTFDPTFFGPEPDLQYGRREVSDLHDMTARRDRLAEKVGLLALTLATSNEKIERLTAASEALRRELAESMEREGRTDENVRKFLGLYGAPETVQAWIAAMNTGAALASPAQPEDRSDDPR